MHNVQYVGETQQTLNAKFRLHESMINARKENLVADHVNEEEHSENRLDYKINIVGQEANKYRTLRLEESWMLLLNTHYKWPEFQVVAHHKNYKTLITLSPFQTIHFRRKLMIFGPKI